MTYNCEITKEDNLYIAKFPDMKNVITYGNSYEEALKMAKEALDGCLASSIDNNFVIPDASYTGGETVEVDPRIAFALELRRARGTMTQTEVAQKAGMSYQQYQRLENPRKTNPTLSTLSKLQKILASPFLAL